MYMLSCIQQPTAVYSCWWNACSSWFPHDYDLNIVSITFAAGQYRFSSPLLAFSAPLSQSGIRHNYLPEINVGFLLRLGDNIPLLPKHHILVANSPLHFQSPRLQTKVLISESP